MRIAEVCVSVRAHVCIRVKRQGLVLGVRGKEARRALDRGDQRSHGRIQLPPWGGGGE